MYCKNNNIIGCFDYEFLVECVVKEVAIRNGRELLITPTKAYFTVPRNSFDVRPWENNISLWDRRLTDYDKEDLDFIKGTRCQFYVDDANNIVGINNFELGLYGNALDFKDHLLDIIKEQKRVAGKVFILRSPTKKSLNYCLRVDYKKLEELLKSNDIFKKEDEKLQELKTILLELARDSFGIYIPEGTAIELY